MPILHAIILGLLQGLTEFLPISSSGHLTIAPEILGWNDGLSNSQYKTFEVALHAGTLIAAISYLRADILRIIKSLLVSIKTKELDFDGKLGFMLLVSAIPGAILGALFENIISEKLGNVGLVASLVIIFGIVLYVCDRINGNKPKEKFNFRDAFFAGTAQAVALAPGVSRSGATMSFFSARGYSRADSARLSFLMLVPIVAGATCFSAFKTVKDGGIPSDLVLPMLVGFVVSAIVGWLAVYGLLKMLQTRSFNIFVVYRLIAGTGALVWYFAK